ncbi:hypothetical protein [Anaerosporobacter sp.]|uniref:hypothetical protein n=1 Tax=Anaerosporobacter sp. TaxID=1872529 RepID=UPI00286F2E96|nr:hypothetical protein [Anaerosporobacter sp.]
MAITEKDITLCGHGSGTPSTKNMVTYLTSRYSSKAPNGVRKGIIKVMRLKKMTDAKRKEFHDTYKMLIGRNTYSQAYRNYVHSKRCDGNYYSDCSSSGMATLQKIGFTTVGLLNTAGIYQSSLFEEVPVEISNGHITNPELLKVGDALLFVGTDSSRPLQIGHVEYIYEIKTGTSSPSTAATYYPTCNAKYTSIVDALASIGVNISKENRSKIYAANFTDTYMATATQNIAMLNQLKAGKLKK